MDVDFDPANSYRVILNDQGQVRWQDGTSVEHLKHDPGASIWQRIGARLLSWLPIEKEL